MDYSQLKNNKVSEANERKFRHCGLSDEQIEVSRKRFGSNIITPPPRDPWWKSYLTKFDDPIIRILVITAIIASISGLINGEYLEGLAIIITIFLATFIGFLNEYKASKEFELLIKADDKEPVKVIRNGQLTEIPKMELVVGDVVLIEAGEQIPADGKVLESVSLQVDESKLTGESFPVAKTTDIQEHPTTYPSNFLPRGAMVAEGYGEMEVTAVGDSTEFGKTSRKAIEQIREPTPLCRSLEELGRRISFIGGSVAIVIFVVMILRGIISGDLILTISDVIALGIIFVSFGVTTIPFWFPMLLDTLELLGFEVTSKGIFSQDTLTTWFFFVEKGLITFLLSFGFFWCAGLVNTDLTSLLSKNVGNEILEYFMVVVAVIVVSVPEGLPMSVTLALAYGMRKMMADQILIRKLHSSETIGAATVVCSDKTGTLTCNTMKVAAVHFPTLVDSNGFPDKIIAEGISANSTAHLSFKNSKKPIYVGNPTEGAFLIWLYEKGFDYLSLRESFKITKQWTFTANRGFMATLGFSPILSKDVLYVKGAPEEVLSRCTSQFNQLSTNCETNGWKEEILKNIRHYQEAGMRVLGFAIGSEQSEGEIDSLARNLSWMGFIALEDPVRDDVKEAIASCRRAGVKVVMVTGDHSQTALEIARRIGLWQSSDSSDQIISGSEFSKLSEKDAKIVAQKLKVVYRAKPLDKLRLVEVFKSMGEVVAVTGDGTNDAPALNRADVGLAMGQCGTDIAKEAGDIVLLNDSFSSIVTAIKWGRALFLNIQRFLIFQLSINIIALGVTLIGPMLGVRLPLTVIQMLWINLIMDTFAALAFATEPPNDNLLNTPPRKLDAFIVSPEMMRIILPFSFVSLIVFLTVLAVFKFNDGVLTLTELNYFFTIFVLVQFWNLFTVRKFGQSSDSFFESEKNPWFILIALVILLGQIIIVQFGGKIFRTTPLSLKEWIFLILITSPVFVIGKVWTTYCLKTNSIKDDSHYTFSL